MLLPCGTARPAVLSSRAESKSAVPCLMVSKGVLLPSLNRNDNFILVRHGNSTTFGTGLIVVTQELFGQWWEVYLGCLFLGKSLELFSRSAYSRFF